MNHSSISDVSIYNSESKTKEDFIKLYNGGIFSDDSKWENYSIKPKIDGIMTGINNPLVFLNSQEFYNRLLNSVLL